MARRPAPRTQGRPQAHARPVSGHAVRAASAVGAQATVPTRAPVAASVSRPMPRWLTVLGSVLLVGLVGLAGWWFLSGDAALPRATPGMLTRTMSILDVPTSLLHAEDCNTELTPWTLPGYTAVTLAALFHDAGLPTVLSTALVEAARCDTAGCAVTPTVEQVLAIPAPARGVLYQALGRYPANALQSAPFRRAIQLPRWRDEAALPPVAHDLMDRLTWQDGTNEVFADVPVVCRALATDAERLRFLSVLKGRPVLTVRLAVAHDEDVEPLVRYWQPQDPAAMQALRARLTALSRLPGGGSVDVVDLMPAMVRARVNTFPTEDTQADCFWTAMHARDTEPSTPFVGSPEALDAALARDWLPEEVSMVRPGDTVVLRRPGGQAVHAATMVADGIVFTKNGNSVRRPWMLSTLDDVRALYPTATQVQYYHPRRSTRAP